MTEVIFKVNGEEKKVNLRRGDRLLDGVFHLNLNEQGMGECGGNCACATCHVYVLEGAENFPEASMDEEDLLDTSPDYQPNSRLACQLVIKKEDKPIVVEVP